MERENAGVLESRNWSHHLSSVTGIKNKRFEHYFSRECIDSSCTIYKPAIRPTGCLAFTERLEVFEKKL